VLKHVSANGLGKRISPNGLWKRVSTRFSCQAADSIGSFGNGRFCDYNRLMDNQQAVALAISLARAAGNSLRQGQKKQMQISRKSSSVDLVTEFDHAAEAIIVPQLRAAFPDHRIVAEEGGESRAGDSPFTWYVDPLDGTVNFAHGYPFYAVSIALYEGRQPILGVIYEPGRDECFHALAGEGAYLTVGGVTDIIRVSGEEQLGAALLATGFPYDRHTSSQDNVAQTAAFLKRAQGLRRAGSACLDLAYVAAGRLDGYWEYKLSPWDIAAGILMAQEAGGQVTAVDGGPLDLTYPISLVASNGRIHADMLDVLHQVQAANTP
jgi:myo-inositol-1(or 4)-monophosphatase